MSNAGLARPKELPVMAWDFNLVIGEKQKKCHWQTPEGGLLIDSIKVT